MVLLISIAVAFIRVWLPPSSEDVMLAVSWIEIPPTLKVSKLTVSEKVIDRVPSSMSKVYCTTSGPETSGLNDKDIFGVDTSSTLFPARSVMVSLVMRMYVLLILTAMSVNALMLLKSDGARVMIAVKPSVDLTAEPSVNVYVVPEASLLLARVISGNDRVVILIPSEKVRFICPPSMSSEKLTNVGLTLSGTNVVTCSALVSVIARTSSPPVVSMTLACMVSHVFSIEVASPGIELIFKKSTGDRVTTIWIPFELLV